MEKKDRPFFCCCSYKNKDGVELCEKKISKESLEERKCSQKDCPLKRDWEQETKNYLLKYPPLKK